MHSYIHTYTQAHLLVYTYVRTYIRTYAHRPIQGPSIKYVTLFLAIFDPPPPVTLCHTSRDPPKVRDTSRTPPFLVGLVQKTQTKALCANSLSIVHGAFCPGVLSEGLLSGRFCPGWFLSIPPSFRIHLLQQKVKHHFKFHVSYV